LTFPVRSTGVRPCTR